MLENLEKVAGAKLFDKLVNDAQNHLKQFEAEIRADERKKVITELINQARKIETRINTLIDKYC